MADDEPIFSKRLAGIMSTVAGGLLLVIVLAVYNAPRLAEEASQRRHDAQELRISALSGELEALRRAYNDHRTIIDTSVAELRITVDAGTEDRFTSGDATREFAGRDALADERQRFTERDIARLDQNFIAIVDFINQERRVYKTEP